MTNPFNIILVGSRGSAVQIAGRADVPFPWTRPLDPSPGPVPWTRPLGPSPGPVPWTD